MSTKRTSWKREEAEAEETDHRGPGPRRRLVVGRHVTPGEALALAERLIAWATSARSAKNHEPIRGGTIPERLEWLAHGNRSGYHRATVEHSAALARVLEALPADSTREVVSNAVLAYFSRELEGQRGRL